MSVSPKLRKRLISLLTACALGVSGLTAVTAATVAITEQPAAAAAERAAILFPFSGKTWYTAADDQPGAHPHYWNAWAMDLHAAPGTAVKARFASSDGNVALSVASIGATCAPPNSAGKNVTVNVYVDGAHVGEVIYGHLNNVQVSAGEAIAVDTTLGYVNNWTESSCWQDNAADGYVHTHMEVEKGCYRGLPDWTSYSSGTPVGLLKSAFGSGNVSVCTESEVLEVATPSPPPPEETEPRYQPFAGDFNGDGIDDIGLRRVATGTFYIRYGPAPAFDTQVTHTWAGGYHLEPYTGDFNGDGVSDLGLRRIATGELYIRYGPDFSVQVTHTWAGTTNYQPLSGDFNADGVDDITLRKVSTGVFYYRYGPGPDFGPQATHTWAGGVHLEPFAGDFNGDGTSDLGLRRIATGELYIRYGPDFSVQVQHNWVASANYQPFTGDFNGDGIDDMGLRKVSTGMFYIRYGPAPTFPQQVTHQWAYG